MSPRRLVGTGLGMMVASWAVVFLMVLREVPPDFLLALAVYTASVVGFGLGVVGVALWGRSRSRS
ncbi:MAG: hypothetical protein RMM30_10680 [Armatimonadota bacterium]|nr:hypothetical protein [Armatimonadota bacterium]MDW8157033.1 hypothetical protein [Armatimonadota bacterium]